MTPVTPRTLFTTALTAGGRGVALTGATLLLMVHALAETAIPVVIGVVIDRAVMPNDRGALFLWLGVLLAVFVMLTAAYQGASRLMVTVYGYGEQALRELALTRILRPLLVKDAPSAGEALTFVTSDTYRVAGVAWSVAQQFAALAAILASGFAMLVISPVATLVVFASTILMMGVMQLVSRPLERRGLDEQSAATEAGAVAADFMSGYRVLVGMGARAEASTRYAAASGRSQRAATAAGTSIAWYETVSGILAAIATAVLAGISAWFASEGRISVGELVTVLGLAQFVSGYLAFAGSFPSNWIHKLASARRLAGLINAPDLLTAPSPSETGAPRLTDLVEPPHEDAVLLLRIADTVLDVRAGELLGVRTPHTGAARNLSRVLGRRAALARGVGSLRTPDGWVDFADLDPQVFRSRVVSLPHRAALGSTTLRAAVVGVGAGGHSEPQHDVVHATALTDVVELLGWDAGIGEFGRRLSGGQHQRIGVARALHTDAEIIVLDHPTSAVDAMTEAHIAAALAARSGTMVVMTSSPVLLAACSRVVEWHAELSGDDDE